MFRKSRAVPLAIVAGASLSLVALRVATPQDPPRPSDAPRPGGPMGPGPGGPGGLGPGSFLAPTIIEAADTDKDGRLAIPEAVAAAERFIRDADEDGQGSIDAATLGRAINRRLGPPPGAEPDGPGAGGPPGGFGPGMFLGPRVLEIADRDKDGRVSPAEAGQAAGVFLTEADPEKIGALDADQLAGAMNRRLGPPPGFGGPGGPMGSERKLVKQFDKDGDGRLDQPERRAARDFLKADRDQNPSGGRGRFGGPPGGGRDEPASPGPAVAFDDAKTYPGQKLYDPAILRTFFLEFEDQDWEAALEELHATDVEVPATLTVDGERYPGVGVHFRGMSSYMMVQAGHKRSLNLSLDYVQPKQRLDGYKTLNLLNSHEDPTFLHTVLYLQIARHYIPAPQANLVKLVINGESWGVYTNAQQFDKILVGENYLSDKGARWKVRGNPGADGGLTDVGDEVEEYKRRYEIKSSDDPKDWQALMTLCRTLNGTPPEKLEAALEPILDVEGVLWFLALDDALINGDGYWTRASDYSIYRNPKGRFHVLPHDANETFGPAMSFGPGMGGGPRGGGGRPGGLGGPGGRPGGPGGGGPRSTGVKLDPLVGLDDTRKPLRSKLLAVPALRSRYLQHVRTIAEEWLDWAKLGPIVAGYHDLINAEIGLDTRKLTSTAAFEATTSANPSTEPDPPGRPGAMSLRAFADQRRRYLLDNPEIQRARP